ncbi:MAG: bifunctional hydroxymethylpyrimidine kinase/phosphomethylpyrimidine kinase [Candidatus Anammoxibacter sp.]
MMKTVMTIAGSDSCCGAGVQADIKTIASLDAYGVCAITALTAQNTRGVHYVSETSSIFVGNQIDALACDFEIAAVKTGMLVNSDIVNEVANKINRFGFNLLVVDPVIVSKNKKKLLSDEAVESMVTQLFPKACLITPNIPEAEILTRRRINNIGDMQAAARALMRSGTKSVLIKGGHLGRSTSCRKKAIDIFYDGKSFKQFESDFNINKEVHGTGCIYSAAITTELAKGESIVKAIHNAKSFISRIIEESVYLGEGYALAKI